MLPEGIQIRTERVAENILRCVIGRETALPTLRTECEDAVSVREDRILWRGKKQLPELVFSVREKPRLVYDTNGQVPETVTVLTVDGERSRVKNLAPREAGTTLEISLRICGGSGILHGLGQGEDGVYDRASAPYYLYQHNMRIPVPFVYSPDGWAIYADCGCLMTLKKDTLTLDSVPYGNFYLIEGNGDACIAAFRKLTGAAAMLPRWAFGYLQSKEAYRSQEELLAIAAEYRRRRIPLDCVIQDWNTWEPGKWGEKKLDESRYPDFPDAARRLHGMHVHTLVSVWPNMNGNTENYREFKEKGKLCWDLSTYNALDEEARRLYWEQAAEGLYRKGFDGWWCDSTEPFSGPDWGGAVRRSEEERFALVGQEHCQFLGAEKANEFALYHARGIFENQRLEDPDRRVVNLTRSGWAGSQKYGTILWSGDVSARWDVMRHQIAEGLNVSMSGLPFWTFDVGGFFVVNTAWYKRGCGCSGDSSVKWFWQGGYNDGVQDPAYRELYVRWLQLGCFMPVFRSHGTDTPREIWRFGEEGDPFYDAIAAGIRLRYSLLPYIYSLAGETAVRNGTFLRPISFDFPRDANAESCREFLFGKALLVCPVLEPTYYEAGGVELDRPKTRLCPLPAGADWIDWYTGRRYAGGETVAADAPIDRIPLFARCGSVIPVTDRAPEWADAYAEEEITLRVFPGCDGSGFYYDDGGDGYGYEAGRYTYVSMRWSETEQSLTLSPAQGITPGKPIRFRVRCGDREKRVIYDGTAQTVSLIE